MATVHVFAYYPERQLTFTNATVRRINQGFQLRVRQPGQETVFSSGSWNYYQVVERDGAVV